MISAFGVDHGHISKAQHRLGFGNQPRVEQAFAPLADTGEAVTGAAKTGRRIRGGKVGMALGGAAASGVTGAVTGQVMSSRKQKMKRR